MSERKSKFRIAQVVYCRSSGRYVQILSLGKLVARVASSRRDEYAVGINYIRKLTATEEGKP